MPPDAFFSKVVPEAGVPTVAPVEVSADDVNEEDTVAPLGEEADGR